MKINTPSLNRLKQLNVEISCKTSSKKLKQPLKVEGEKFLKFDTLLNTDRFERYTQSSSCTNRSLEKDEEILVFLALPPEDELAVKH